MLEERTFNAWEGTKMKLLLLCLHGFEEYGFYEEAYKEPTLELIRSFAAAKKPIASVCVGTFPVAKS